MTFFIYLPAGVIDTGFIRGERPVEQKANPAKDFMKQVCSKRGVIFK